MIHVRRDGAEAAHHGVLCKCTVMLLSNHSSASSLLAGHRDIAALEIVVHIMAEEAHPEIAWGAELSRRTGDIQILGQNEPDTPHQNICLLYTSPSPRDRTRSRMPSSA